MLLPQLPSGPGKPGPLPLWPPLLATRGPGSRTGRHGHHAMHLMLACGGEIRVDGKPTPGVLTAPDAPHRVDATGVEIALVFLDPESQAGAALRAGISGAYRLITRAECTELLQGLHPEALIREGGAAWTAHAVEVLGVSGASPSRQVHPRVRKLLRALKERDGKSSLEELAEVAGLSEGRLMHVFTESIGIPLRPYLAWLRLQRAAGAIVSGVPLSDAAHAAGFSDAAHMSRTFRRMLGVAPSALRHPGSPAR